MHNNNNYQCKMCWNKALTFGVGPNITTFQSNCAEGLHFSAFHYYCCACSKKSISIFKYIQKAGEPDNDAGFLKHIAS